MQVILRDMRQATPLGITEVIRKGSQPGTIRDIRRGRQISSRLFSAEHWNLCQTGNPPGLGIVLRSLQDWIMFAPALPVRKILQDMTIEPNGKCGLFRPTGHMIPDQEK